MGYFSDKHLENQEADAAAPSAEARTALVAHTPGPWELDVIHDQGGEQIPDEAFVTGGELDEADYFEVNIRGGYAQANARLIAAAPDMLAALKALVGEDSASAGMRFSARIALANAAIAKATRGVS